MSAIGGAGIMSGGGAYVSAPLANLYNVERFNVHGSNLADTLVCGIGDSKLYGNGCDDLITGNRQPATGNDELYGGDGSDSLNGSDGNDQVFGGAGYDYLIGGGASDYLIGGDGDDIVYGDQGEGADGTDYLYGGAGFDVLVGGGQWDRIYGKSGDDIIYGYGGGDLIWGGAGVAGPGQRLCHHRSGLLFHAIPAAPAEPAPQRNHHRE